MEKVKMLDFDTKKADELIEIVNSDSGAKGLVTLNDYILVNGQNPCETKHKAESFIKFVTNLVYGEGIRRPPIQICGDFKINETNGKFYIWHNPLIKHTL